MFRAVRKVRQALAPGPGAGVVSTPGRGRAGPLFYGEASAADRGHLAACAVRGAAYAALVRDLEAVVAEDAPAAGRRHFEAAAVGPPGSPTPAPARQ